MLSIPFQFMWGGGAGVAERANVQNPIVAFPYFIAPMQVLVVFSLEIHANSSCKLHIILVILYVQYTILSYTSFPFKIISPNISDIFYLAKFLTLAEGVGCPFPTPTCQIHLHLSAWAHDALVCSGYHSKVP